MKKIVLWLCVLLLSSCHIHLSTNEKDYYPFGEKRFKLNQYFSALRDLQQFNGVVFIKQNEEVILHQAYNLTQFDSSSLKVSKNSQFDIRSVSKLLAKASIYELENQSLIQSKNHINSYQLDVPFAHQVTVQHLMDNQSGLPRELKDGTLGSELSVQQLIKKIAAEDLEFTPGTDSRYSNLGFQLLYQLIAQISQSSFEVFLNKTFFQPLQMNHTGAHYYLNKDNLENYAYGHTLSDGVLIPLLELDQESFKPGKIYSTAENMMRFLDYLSSAEYKQELMHPDTGKITHAGGTDGKRAYVEIDTLSGYQIVFLSNYDEIPFSQIVKDIQSIMQNEPYHLPTQVKRQSRFVSKQALQKYIGNYIFKEINHLKLQVRLNGDHLVISQEGEPASVLYAESDSVFFTEPDSLDSFEFVKAASAYELNMDWKGATWKGLKEQEE